MSLSYHVLFLHLVIVTGGNFERLPQTDVKTIMYKQRDCSTSNGMMNVKFLLLGNSKNSKNIHDVTKFKSARYSNPHSDFFTRCRDEAPLKLCTKYLPGIFEHLARNCRIYPLNIDYRNTIRGDGALSSPVFPPSNVPRSPGSHKATGTT